jgi:hypothetical protein
MQVMCEGLKRAKKAGKVDGPGLKAALETLKDYDTGGLTPPITFTAKDHRPSTTCTIYGMKDAKPYIIKEVTVAREDQYIGK